MKKHSQHPLLCFFLLVLTACSGNNQFPSTAVSTEMALKTVTPSLVPVLPTAVPSDTSTPFPPQNREGQVVWAPDIEPVKIENHLGYGNKFLWSPSNNEILYMDCEENHITILKAGEPEFQSKRLAVASQCDTPNYVPDMTWRPNGQHILYFGRSEQRRNDIWIMDSDGQDQHPLNINEPWQIPTFASWLDTDIFLFSNYSGGGHLQFSDFNLTTGETNKIALVPGETHPANNGYIPITYEPFPGEYHQLVISRKLPVSNESLDTFQADGHYAPIPSFDSGSPGRTFTIFKGWLPGTNQMLIEWQAYSADGILQKQHLLLWDVVQNSLSLFAPNSFDGAFSADGNYFAYSSIGPAKLVNGRPVDYDNQFHPRLYEGYDANTFPDFIQILDLNQQQVILSLPGLYKGFSMDGQYLVFTTAGKVQTDDQNWPVGVIEEDEQESYLNILDLDSRKLSGSIPGVSNFLSWSPDNQKFLFQDPFGNLHLYDTVGQESRAITEDTGLFEIRQVDWSPDGRYISLHVKDTQQNGLPFIFILKTP